MINLNTATQQELVDLGIPETDARSLINYRTENGPFRSTSSLFSSELPPSTKDYIQELINGEEAFIGRDEPVPFSINIQPIPLLDDFPELRVELVYTTSEDESETIVRSFSPDRSLSLTRSDASPDSAIRVQVTDEEGQTLVDRTYSPKEISRTMRVSERLIFVDDIDVNLLRLTAPEDRRLVRSGRYVTLTDPKQRFDGYRLTVSPIRAETEQPSAALLNQENGLTTGAIELDSQDPQTVIHLSTLQLSSASLDFNGSFSIDHHLEHDSSEYSGWVWLLAGPSMFFGFQQEQHIATPDRDLVIPLPASDISSSGALNEVPYDASETALLDRPDIFADDPGTTCKPFNNPGRILGERRFSTVLRVTQPEIDDQTTSDGAFIENPRFAVDKRNAIDWEGDTTEYQARTVSRGHIVEFRVRWRSNGYSLGNVTHSMTLAPRQTRRIVKVDYERRERAARREETVSSDEVEQVTLRERDYSDAVESALSEWSRGGSKAKVTSAAGGAGFAALGFVIGGGAAHSTSSSSSWQQGGRNVTASEQQSLRDSIRQYGDSLRSFESTVITEAEQEESVEGVSEVVRNINYCHALSVIYYEILRHLRVDTEVGGVRECLFVPLTIEEFDDDRIAKHQRVLRQYVRDRAQRNALRYVEDIQNEFRNSDIPADERYKQKLTYLNGSIDLQLSITRPREGEVAEEVEEGTRREFSETERFRKMVDEFENIAYFLPKSPTEIVHDLHEIKESQRDRYFQRNIAPHMARRFADRLEIGTESDGAFTPLDADFTLAGSYRYGRTVQVDFTVDVDDDLTREKTRNLVIRTSSEDLENTSLPPRSVANVTRGRITFATDHYRRNNVYSDRGVREVIQSDTGQPDPDGANLLFDFSSYEKTSVQEELNDAYEELKKELNQNIYRYHKAIWWNMDRDALYTLLDGFAISDEDGRSIASLVERRPIGILGNTLVFRVSAGTLLDPNFSSPEALLNHYRAETPKADPLRVSLPTSGLYARAHMDDCNACEEHEGTQDWVLADPDPELADLPASLLQSRRSQSTDLTPSQFPETLINLQNAPAAPEPAGLSEALGAVASGDAFRDMAGLTGTQQAAVSGMQTATGLASAFGQNALASKLANIGADKNAAKNVAAMADAAKRAVEKGQMTQGTAKEVVKNFADKMTKRQGTDTADSVAESAKELVSELGRDGSATLATADDSGASFASFSSVLDDPNAVAQVTGDESDDTASDAAPSNYCATYTPTRTDRLVVAATEYTIADLTIINWLSPNVLRFTPRNTVCRDTEDVDEIIIHESTSNTWDVDDEQRNMEKEGNSVHLAILRDGTVYQHLDLVQRGGHATPHNTRSIGIEIVNQPIPRAAVTETEDSDRVLVDTTWAAPRTRSNDDSKAYILPTEAQMQSLYTLSEWLVEEDATHSLPVPLSWPGISHDHYIFYFFDEYREDDPITNIPSITAHGHIGGPGRHVDGHFATLYLWLRMSANGGQGVDHETAWERAKTLASEASFGNTFPVESLRGHPMVDITNEQ